VARKSRQSSEEFEKYQEFIVEHKNYASLPNKRNQAGEITWVRPSDKERARWWDDLKSELGQVQRSDVARLIHPVELGGMKPCQICGRKMSIKSIYPDKRAVAKLSSAFPELNIVHFVQDIYQVAELVERKFSIEGLNEIAKIFGIEGEFSNGTDLSKEIASKNKCLSPGVMSNAPDRLEGFHTYNACCRAEQDTGRHSSNLARYATDRRAYENWADGDWRGADRLMGLYRKQKAKHPCPVCGQSAKLTADHIGPISLGFMHRMEFQPMCIDCNSSKNNRLTHQDVVKLRDTESSGIPIVSWHSTAIWNSLHPLVIDDVSAVRLSSLMRRNLHHVLTLLSMIQESGQGSFLLQFLHPEYALFDWDFSAFDPVTGIYKGRRFEVDTANTRKQAQRYIRVSFESLDTYADKDNRKASMWNNKNCDSLLIEILARIVAKDQTRALEKIRQFLGELARQAKKEFLE
jgi:Alw26I/Eco31I/Esp3I family type II restriction endonuclease